MEKMGNMRENRNWGKQGKMGDKKEKRNRRISRKTWNRTEETSKKWKYGRSRKYATHIKMETLKVENWENRNT